MKTRREGLYLQILTTELCVIEVIHHEASLSD
jgi:hypothetical protein